MLNNQKWLWTFILLISSTFANAQRFLTPVFDAVDITTDITYGNATNYEGDEEELILDFYDPAVDTMPLRPMVIYVHGGGFVDTNQSKSLVHIAAFCDSLARRGYVAAAINYRLDTSISNRAVINAMHDAKAAVRFFKANYLTYKVDTNLMFIGGESAGAITSLTTNYINLPAETAYPPTLPLASDLSLEGTSGSPGHSSQTKGTLCFCGGTKTVFEEELFDTLAIQNSSDPTLLVVHGTGDVLIPTIRALELAIRAHNVELPYLFYTMPGATHCPWFFPLENSWDYLDTLISYTVPFLYACVNEPVGIPEELYENQLVVYPNPAIGAVTLSFGSAKQENVQVFDATGQLIYQSKIYSNTSIDISTWEKGLYLIAVPDLGITKRLVKE